ncbi:MAG: hypothetical protein HY784_06515 [Chloroflexi bacterium]|nr:hypothetical protein [Chloroflexota bacterium]
MAVPISLTLDLSAELTEQLGWLARERGEPAEQLAVQAIEWFVQVAGQETIPASTARRAANRAVFGELAGLSISCGQPLFVAGPSPRWRVPYTAFDGTLMLEVEVDAQNGNVALSEPERADLLSRVGEHYKRKRAPA